MKPGLQELYLNAMRKERLPATFFLVNGFQMKGIVQAFDPYTLVVQSNGSQELIFKHAISTIIPSKPIDLTLLDAEAAEAE